MSILDDIYYGELESPQRPAAYWEEMRDVDKLIRRAYDELYPGLTASQKKLWDDIEKLLTEKSMIDARYSFRTGFRIAARIFTEALSDK
ncbi:MAG: hypothetical protein J6N32_09980 [Clostridia bacterium]|nr:hypothetical protein [Clostridia bacterium]MBP3294068.1 hypothetical protein [Clostridia bacterium]